MSRLNRLGISYIDIVQRRAGSILLFGLVLTAFGAWSASRFELKTDFAQLLPQDEPSIKDLNRAKKRMGSMSNLIVTVEGDDPSFNKKVVDELVAKFKTLPEEYLVYLKYNIKEEKSYYEKYKHLFVDLDDLKTIYKRLRAKIRYERIKNNPVLNMDFDGEKIKPVEFDLSDVSKKYEKKKASADKYLDGYFTTEGGKLYAILLYPPGSSTGVAFGKRFIKKVQRSIIDVCKGDVSVESGKLEKTLSTACTEHYGNKVKIGWTGSIVTAIVEQKSIMDDLILVTSICLSLVALVVLLYFRKFRSLPVVGIPLLMGTTWTFGLSIFIVGNLNTSTAFLAAIIVGNGINFGLIQLSRYMEERRSGKSHRDALLNAIVYTLKATGIAASAASIAYGSLIITKFRGFNGFGYMGGLGMLLCWVSAFTMQPALLSLLEKVKPAKFDRKNNLIRVGAFSTAYGKGIVRFSTPINFVGLAFAILCVVVAIPYLHDPFEYDFRNLRNQHEGVERYQLASRVEKIFPRRMNPLFVLADRLDQVPLITFEMNRNNTVGDYHGLFQEIRSVYSQLPTHQKAKLKVLKKIKKLLSKSTLSWLTDEQRKHLDEYMPPKNLHAVTIADLPKAMTRLFTEKNATVGLPVAIYPRHGRSTWDGHFLIEISNASRQIDLPDGNKVTSAGAATIFADMISAIERDGPRAVMVSLLGVMLLVLLAYRVSRFFLIILVTLFFGVVWTIGPVAMLGMKLNFLNFIGLPITFGIGIDYAVNVLNRYKIDGSGSMAHSVASTGGAVALCSLTTLIGYSSLLIADNNALVSFGLLSDIGEVASLAAAIFMMPALVTWIEHRDIKNRAQKNRKSLST